MKYARLCTYAYSPFTGYIKISMLFLQLYWFYVLGIIDNLECSFIYLLRQCFCIVVIADEYYLVILLFFNSFEIAENITYIKYQALLFSCQGFHVFLFSHSFLYNTALQFGNQNYRKTDIQLIFHFYLTIIWEEWLLCWRPLKIKLKISPQLLWTLNYSKKTVKKSF